jgi:hypothetical protein
VRGARERGREGLLLEERVGYKIGDTGGVAFGRTKFENHKLVS